MSVGGKMEHISELALAVMHEGTKYGQIKKCVKVEVL